MPASVILCRTKPCSSNRLALPESHLPLQLPTFTIDFESRQVAKTQHKSAKGVSFISPATPPGNCVETSVFSQSYHGSLDQLPAPSCLAALPSAPLASLLRCTMLLSSLICRCDAPRACHARPRASSACLLPGHLRRDPKRCLHDQGLAIDQNTRHAGLLSCVVHLLPWALRDSAVGPAKSSTPSWRAGCQRIRSR